MTDHQSPQVREPELQTDQTVFMSNEDELALKRLGELERHVEAQLSDILLGSGATIDPRLFAIAKTEIELGFMAAMKSLQVGKLG